MASPPAGLSSHAHPSKGKKWIAPPSGWVKINVDAATAKNGPGGAVAVVCRSEAGTFMGASTLTISGLDNPATLEAVACREALALAQDLSLSHVCVASDCLEVIRNLQQPYMGAYSMIVDEIKETKTLFSSVSFRHEGRSTNGKAHRLARSASHITPASPSSGDTGGTLTAAASCGPPPSFPSSPSPEGPPAKPCASQGRWRRGTFLLPARELSMARERGDEVGERLVGCGRRTAGGGRREAWCSGDGPGARTPEQRLRDGGGSGAFAPGSDGEAGHGGGPADAAALGTCG
ncbi:hypothetical protein QYE76_044199 [Lolium multiflorum]|uniref:RNase H type-1 domain-containing protein n=1 Tax=Lolium multiflorum TaxID=4521 RepID=A0AAD8TKM4_LOLMU|nr:hypothetical protein QYE76_044199 [Lolium multiflorum]